MARHRSYMRFAYLKVEEIRAAVQDKEHQHSINHISKYLNVQNGITQDQKNPSFPSQDSNIAL
jgi:hypothetical protein